MSDRMVTDDNRPNTADPDVLWYDQVGMHDVDRVGGKNASLGEMISHLTSLGVQVPNGFATTASAWRRFLEQSGLDARIHALLDETDIDDTQALAAAGTRIRQWVIDTPFTAELDDAIATSYAQLAGDNPNASFAVRSSATAEDMPDASFAGQQETFLNVQGLDAVREAVHHVFASLFPRHLLPRPSGLRPQGRGTVRRRPAHGALGSGHFRRHVHHRHRIRL